MKIVRLCTAVSAAALMVVACGSDDGATGEEDAADSGVIVPPAKVDSGSNDAGAKADANDASPPAVSASVGGTVSGLAGKGLVLQNNAGDDLPVAADGTFTFSKKLASGEAFAVTVKTQPTGPAQTCSVSGGTGTVAAGNVSTVSVNCATDKFTVGGTVSGLVGTGLVLQNNAGSDLIVNANGSFAFATTIASGAAYAVTVKGQPPTQTCTVSAGTGTVGAANVTSVVVACVTTKFAVGGTIVGLAQGDTVVLQNSAGDNLSRNANGAFAFVTPVEQGQPYAVSVLTQPANTTCAVTSGAGTMPSSDVTGVVVNCCAAGMTLDGGKCKATYLITDFASFYSSTYNDDNTCGVYAHPHSAPNTHMGIRWNDTAPAGYVASAVTADLFLGLATNPQATTPALTLNGTAAGSYASPAAPETCPPQENDVSVALPAAAVAAYVRGAQNDLRSASITTPLHDGFRRLPAVNNAFARIIVSY